MKFGAALAALAVAVAVVAGCGEQQPQSIVPPVAFAAVDEPEARRVPDPFPPTGRGWAVWVRRPVALRDAAGGRRVATARTATPYGTDTLLPVVSRTQRWAAVMVDGRRRRAYVRLDPRRVRAIRRRTAVVVDRSDRELIARVAGRIALRATIAVGGPATPTPIGRFGVTDTLRPPPGGPYGRMILALSGRQPRLPPDWPGGDRLALHGTLAEASVGAAASFGCLRLRDADLRRLARLAPPGTLVTVRA